MPGPGMEVVGQEEIQEVLEVLRSQWLYRYGELDDPNFKQKVIKWEEAVSNLSNVRYAVAVNSGTSALLVALGALGVGPGDEVIVPGYTFIASISSVVYARAIPVLTEVDRTFNLDPADVEAKITPRTKAIMAVHMMGNPARLDELRAIADKHGLALIEDCAQAFGASYKGHPIGSIGDIGTFSFNAYKTITAGDGGMVITNDENLHERSFAFHDQGHSPLRAGVDVGKRPLIGMSFRLTEIQAAVLLGQLKKLPDILAHLRVNKTRFKELIADLPGIEFRELPDPDGDICTLLTTIMPTPDIAEKVSAELGGKPMSAAGWHVYNNMENILEQRTITPEQCPFTCPYYTNKGGDMKYHKGMLPRTDALLARSVNISIGVPDPGLRSSFGVSMNDGLDVVEQRAEQFRQVASKYLK
jgi:dTDP-4-amino-4,6-dideoxygalactose transaminase